MERIEDTEELIRDIDAKDKKIMGELFRNARASYSEIAKNVRLSKESVNYRVNRLMENGIVTGFNTVIDVKRIGWELFFASVRLRNIDTKTEKEILSALSSHPNVAWVIKCIGSVDIKMKILAKNIAELTTIVKHMAAIYKLHFNDYEIQVITQERAVPFAFLYGSSSGKEIYSLHKQREMVEVTPVDLKLLQVLSNNARMPLTEIAQKIKISRDLLQYRLSRLEKTGVILKYRPDVWPKKLGYNWYLLSLSVGELQRQVQNQLESLFLTHPNVTYFYTTIGTSDIEVELRVKTSKKLSEILLEVRSILKDTLKRHEIQIILQEYKYTYFPQCLMQV